MKKKRILALVLSMLLISALFVPAFADAEPDLETEEEVIVVDDDSEAAEISETGDEDPDAIDDSAEVAEPEAEVTATNPTSSARKTHLIVGGIILAVCCGVTFYAFKRKR